MTLETAKALKEAGWDKETIHFQYLDNYTIKLYLPSLEELLAVMRDVFLWKTKLCYHTQLNGKPETECMSNNPTEAVAQLWLKLRKEGIV